MRAYFRLAMLVPAFLFILPVLAQAPSSLPGENNDEGKAKLKLLQSIAKAGKFMCQISGKPEEEDAEKIFEVKVDYEVKKINPEGMKKYQDVYKQYRAAYFRRDKGTVQRLYPQLAQLAPGAYDVERMPITLKLVHGMASESKTDKGKGDKTDKADKGKGDKTDKTKEEKGDKAKSKTADKGKPAGKELVIRREVLPPKDENDPAVKYTKEELKELKGPGNLPGYAASLKDLENEMTVMVYVDKARFKPPMPPKRKKGEEEPAAEEEDKPIPILWIMIPKPPPEPTVNPLINSGGK